MYNNINDFIKRPPMHLSNIEDCKSSLEDIRNVWLSSFPKKALEKSYTHRLHQRGTFAVCGHNDKMFKIFGVYETAKDAKSAIDIACSDVNIGDAYKRILDFMILDLRVGPITFPFPVDPIGVETVHHNTDPHKEFWNHQYFDLKTECDIVSKRMLREANIKSKEKEEIEKKIKFNNIETEMKVLNSTC